MLNKKSPQLRTITEIVAVADLVSARCTTSFGAPTAGDETDRDLSALFARNGFGVTSVDSLISRTKAQLERSKAFLVLLDSGSPTR